MHFFILDFIFLIKRGKMIFLSFIILTLSVQLSFGSVDVTDQQLQMIVQLKQNLYNSFKFENLPNCGRSQITVKLPIGRIIKGTYAVKDRWPWIVSIQMNTPFNKTYNHLCGGAILNQQYILTAAHCVENRAAQFMTVYAGVTDFKDVKTSDIYQVEKYYLHNRYKQTEIQNGFDIAVLKLKKPLKFSAKVNSVCLPTSSKDAPKVIKKSVMAIGWFLIFF